MWVFDWLTTPFSGFFGPTFQKKLDFSPAALNLPRRDVPLPCSALIIGHAA
jgi:hypothetical protein